MAVFHLKYRPRTWTELDQTTVAEKIRKYVQSEAPPQSYLFSGPKGAGKTSAARILAKAFNCEKAQNGEPCNECEMCQEVNRGSSLDVIEIDAASNRGIEDVRELKDRAYLLPTKLKRKVFIIDEVHMLTREAFNALLKLLEEPPAHTIFVLCTTEPQKVPETVLSRLVRIDFHKGTKKELEKSLLRTIKGEGIDMEEKALKLLVDRCDGSFRNLQRSFNEMVMELGKKITYEMVEDYLSKGKKEYEAEHLEQDLAEGNVKKSIKHLEEMAEVGLDFREYRERLIAYFQKKLVGWFGGDEDKGALSLEQVTRLLNLLILAGKQEKEAVLPQLPLELAVVEFLGGKKDIENKHKDERISADSTDETAAKKGEAVAEAPTAKTEDIEVEEKIMVEVNLSKEQIENDWLKLLAAVKPYNHSVEAFLRSARPMGIKSGEMVIEVFYPFHKDKLEENKNRKILETGIKQVWGVVVGVKCVLGKDKKPALVINNDTPIEKVSDQLAAEANKTEVKTDNKDIYDVAKEIFG